MAIEALEVRMARLEGAYEQISERLGGVEREIGGLRSEVKTEISSIRSEIVALRSELTPRIDGLQSGFEAKIGEVRRRMDTQFYWLLTFILGSILIPLLRDLRF